MKETSPAENIFLGNEITHNGLLDYETMTLRCQKLFAQVNLSISPDTRVGDLGLASSNWLKLPRR